MKRASICLVLAMLAFSVSSALADATLRPGDSFDLRIGGVPADDQATISSNYTVDGDGYLNLPYLGRIQVARMTASAIQVTIEHAYTSQGIFTHPTITLNIAPSARFVNVGGQVKAPQRVAYTPDMTVLSAINAAGDFSDYADQGKVQLTRDGRVSIVNCKKARKDPSQDVKVLPGDRIQVPEGFW